jgi:GNAT superfamily N-acetyltransferase
VSPLPPGIAVRTATKADYGYVFDTWCESSCRSMSGVSPKQWRHTVGDLVAISLRQHKLSVACDVEDEARLYGWACGDEGRMLYVYVRTTMRRLGIGRALVERVCGGVPKSAAWMTPSAQQTAARYGVLWLP